MKRPLLLLTLLLTALTASLAGAQTRLLRSPDVSDTQIVFSYGGDLWIVDREGGVTIVQTAPFETRQQSRTWNGSTTQGDAWYSSRVRGSRFWARGFMRAHSREDTAMLPSWSCVVPNRSMCRRAAVA